MTVQKTPQGFSSVTPYLMIEGAQMAIDIYTQAFGAKEENRMTCPQTGKIMHTVLTIGNSKLMLSDAWPESECGKATSSSFYIYVDDVDAAFKKASTAGLKDTMKPEDMFWGDRTAAVTDPFGNVWTLATHVRDMSKDEIEQAAKEWMQKKAA